MVAGPDRDGDVDAGPSLLGADMRMVVEPDAAGAAFVHVRAVRVMIVPGRLDGDVPVVAEAEHRRLRQIRRRQRQQ